MDVCNHIPQEFQVNVGQRYASGIRLRSVLAMGATYQTDSTDGNGSGIKYSSPCSSGGQSSGFLNRRPRFESGQGYTTEGEIVSVP